MNMENEFLQIHNFTYPLPRLIRKIILWFPKQTELTTHNPYALSKYGD